MGAWGRDQGVDGRVRMMADGSAAWTRALGLELDLTARGMGVRSQRYSALLQDGVVKKLNIEKAGQYEVSDAKTLLEQLGPSRYKSLKSFMTQLLADFFSLYFAIFTVITCSRILHPLF